MTQYSYRVALIEEGGPMPAGISFFSPPELVRAEIERRAALLFGPGVLYEVVSVQGECAAPRVELFRGRTGGA